MKRRIFFWLEKLKITPTERKTVSGLMILLVLLAGLNMGMSATVPFADEDYLELEQQFEERTAMLKQKQEKLMERYDPSPKRELQTAVLDTVLEDTLEKKTEQKTKGLPEKERVNINEAGKEELESLPGIGPTYAQRIIDYRREQGEFKALKELKKIKGIAQKRLDKLKAFVKL